MHSCVWDASKWINCIQSRWLRPDHAFSDPYFYYLNMTNEFVFLISANWNVVSELVNIETNVFEIVFFGCTTWRDINFIFMILQCFELKDIYISIHFFKCFFKSKASWHCLFTVFVALAMILQNNMFCS